MSESKKTVVSEMEDFDAEEHHLESKDDRSGRDVLKGQVKIFVKDEAPPQKITAARYCASLPLKPDQTAGFLAECRLKYPQNDLATMEEWAMRHEAFKQRPVK